MLKRVLVWVGGWRKESLRRREAVKAAVKHFQATNGLPARSSISKVIAQEEDSYVVRVSGRGLIPCLIAFPAWSAKLCSFEPQSPRW